MSPEAPVPAYVIALLQVPDVERYRRDYGRHVAAQVTALGGRLLVATPAATTLEGESGTTWTAVLEFPDRATALRWYHSAEYAPLKQLRLEELTTGGTVALCDGYRPAAPTP